MLDTKYLLLIISLATTPTAIAEAPADSEAARKGREIAEEADRRASGYIDSEESLTMVLHDKKGRKRLRTMRMKTFERSDDGDWSLTIFDEPADVKGTAMLTYSHGVNPDDQWLYLPALKRVKRISSKNRSGPFMGSELSFEDMSDFMLEKYNYHYLRDEACGELQCFVSEWIPAYLHSGYTRIEIWHDQDEYRTRKIQFYDKLGRHLKTLTASNFKRYNERFWRSLRWEMINHKTGKITVLNFNSIELGVGLTERDFDQNSLRRAK